MAERILESIAKHSASKVYSLHFADCAEFKELVARDAEFIKTLKDHLNRAWMCECLEFDGGTVEKDTCAFNLCFKGKTYAIQINGFQNAEGYEISTVCEELEQPCGCRVA